MIQIHYARDILKLDGANASLIARRVGRSPSTIRKWMRDGIPKGAKQDCVDALKRYAKRHPTSDPRQPKNKKPTPDLRQPKNKKAIGNRPSAVSSRPSAVSKKWKPVAGRKPIAESRAPKKAARVPLKPAGGKPQKQPPIRRPQTSEQKKAISRRQSAVGEKASVGRQKPIAESRPAKKRPVAPTQRKPSRKAVGRQPSAISQKVKLLSGRLPIADSRGPTIVPLTEREKAESEQQLRLAMREQKRIHDIKEHKKAVRLVNQIRKSGVNGMRRVYRLHGKNKLHRILLSDMIINEDEAWTKFVDLCEELGLTNVEIRNAWFSPK